MRGEQDDVSETGRSDDGYVNSWGMLQRVRVLQEDDHERLMTLAGWIGTEVESFTWR